MDCPEDSGVTAPRPAGHGWEARQARPAVEPEAAAGLPGSSEGRRSSFPRRPFPGEMPWARGQRGPLRTWGAEREGGEPRKAETRAVRSEGHRRGRRVGTRPEKRSNSVCYWPFHETEGEVDGNGRDALPQPSRRGCAALSATIGGGLSRCPTARVAHSTSCQSRS